MSDYRLTTKTLFGGILLMVMFAGGVCRAQTESPNRYRTFLFGVDYYPEQWPESYWERDAQRMQECGVNAVRIGEFGWGMMEANEGKFDFALFDRVIAVL